MSSYSLRVGAAVARTARSVLAPPCLLVTSSAGLITRWLRASLTALRVPANGSANDALDVVGAMSKNARVGVRIRRCDLGEAAVPAKPAVEHRRGEMAQDRERPTRFDGREELAFE